MSTQTKIALTPASLGAVKIPLQAVRAIISERVTVTRTQLCDEFHVILTHLEHLVNTFSGEVYTADSTGQTVSYAQLYATLNHLQSQIGASKEQVLKLRRPRT